MRRVLDLLIACALASLACACSVAVDLDPSLLDPDAGQAGDTDGGPDATPCRDDRDCGDASCVRGDCACDEGLLCERECVDAMRDEHNCGSCGHVCGRGQDCRGGVCDDGDHES